MTTVVPVGSKLPTVEELRKPGALERLRALGEKESDKALLPREALGPSRKALPRAAAEDSATATPERALSRREAATAPVRLPEPPHTITPKQCEKGLGDKKFYVRSRFAVCSGRVYLTAWTRQGRPIGTSYFTVLAIGTIPKNSRTMTVTYHFTNFVATGTNGAAGSVISTKAEIANSWPSRVRYKHGGVGTSMPVRRTWAELLNGGNFKHTVSAAAGQGQRGDDAIYAVYKAHIRVTAPPGWTEVDPTEGFLSILPPRWDKAKYLPNRSKGAAVFSVSTALVYSTKANAPEKDVAKHIKKGYTTPGRTKPPFSRKHLPGSKADEPLTRLYKDGARRKENRNTAVYNCRKYFGEDYSDGGKKECDEFPFATTYQGAAEWKHNPQADRYNFSVESLPQKANGAAGNLLRDYYDVNRMIDGPDDGFLVKITS